jgi:hypothetical protein
LTTLPKDAEYVGTKSIGPSSQVWLAFLLLLQLKDSGIHYWTPQKASCRI